MPTVNTIVQNTVMKTKMPGNLGSKIIADRSLLGNGDDRSLVQTAPPEKKTDYAESFIGGKTELNNKVRDYDEGKSTFQSEFRSRMDSLKKASGELKNLNSERTTEQGAALRQGLSGMARNNSSGGVRDSSSPVAGRDFTAGFLKEKEETQETPSVESRAERELDAQEREDFRAIRGFVEEFNSTMSYLSEEGGSSGRLSAFADSFGDSGGLSDSLGQIGISVGSGGALSVDETRLAESLSERPSDVGAALGAEGMAGQLERRVDQASRQADRLFPSLSAYLGGTSADPAKAMYSGESLPAKNPYTDVGSIYHTLG